MGQDPTLLLASIITNTTATTIIIISTSFTTIITSIIRSGDSMGQALIWCWFKLPASRTPMQIQAPAMSGQVQRIVMVMIIVIDSKSIDTLLIFIQ